MKAMARFGDFASLCRQVPSYPWCNLFFRQVYPSFVLARPLEPVYGIIGVVCRVHRSYSPSDVFVYTVDLPHTQTQNTVVLDHHPPIHSTYPFILRPITHSISQMQKRDPSILTGLSTDASSAPVGVNPACGIPRVGTSTVEFGGPSGDSLGNIANIVACGLSIFFVVALIAWTSRRKAAVGEL